MGVEVVRESSKWDLIDGLVRMSYEGNGIMIPKDKCKNMAYEPLQHSVPHFSMIVKTTSGDFLFVMVHPLEPLSLVKHCIWINCKWS